VKILIVEDQPRLADFLMKSLSDRAYTVKCAPNCAQARDALCESSYDAIVLDIGLPDGDGFELLRQWRAGGFNEPVLILSARDTVQDRIKGLDLGADDYLPKPFSLEELLARVRSLLRRQTGAKKTLLEHRGLKLDLLSCTVSLHEQPVEMTSREYALLEFLALHRGKLVTRTMLYEHLFDENDNTLSNLLDVHVSNLRKKLGAEFITTRRGHGYCIE